MGDIDVYPYSPLVAVSPSTLGYAENTNMTLAVTTATDLPGLTVTFTVPAGRRVKVTAHAYAQNTVAGNRSSLLIMEGATQLQGGLAVHAAAAVNDSLECTVSLSPAAGTHAYKLQGIPSAGTSTFGGNVPNPAFILVEDITTPGSAAAQPVPVGLIAQAYNFGNGFTFTARATIPGASLNVTVPAGRVLKVTAKAHLYSSTATDRLDLFILQDGTVLDGAFKNNVVSGQGQDTMASITTSPSAGAHTYTLQVQRDGTGTGSVYSLPGDSQTWFIIEDITSTPPAGQGAPGSLLAYTQQPSSVTGLTTTLTDITNLTATVTVPAGRQLRIRGHVIAIQGTAVENKVAVYIMEGVTKLGFAEQALNPTVGTSSTLDPECVVSPSAGTHTYKLAGQFAAGSSNQFYQDTTNGQYCFITVEDITGSTWPVGSSITAGMVASEPWTDYIPTLVQSVAVAKTIATARYSKVGRTVTGVAYVQVTGTGTAANGIKFGLPVPAATTNSIMVGIGYVYDNSASLLYTGVATILNTTEVQFLAMVNGVATQVLGAASFTAALAVSDLVSMIFTYEAAS